MDATASATIGQVDTASTGPSASATAPLRAGPQLFIVADCDRPHAPSSRHSLEGLYLVGLGRADARGAERQDGRLALKLTDARVSTKHAHLVHDGDAWWLEDLDSKNGTFLGGKRVTRERLSNGDWFQLGHTFLLYRDVDAAGAAPDGSLDWVEPKTPLPGLATLNPELSRMLAALADLAATSIGVLVVGETGTG
jgi:hypothetical protein